MFYVISNVMFFDTYFAYGEILSDNETWYEELCNECGTVEKRMAYDDVLEVKPSRKRIGDFMKVDLGFKAIFSEKFIKAFENNGLNGLSQFKKVKIVSKHLQDQNYYCPRIKHIFPQVDDSKFDYMEKIPCANCQRGKSIIDDFENIVLRIHLA